MQQNHPVIIIGLAAAAHLLERGQQVRVLESGAGPAAAMSRWPRTSTTGTG